YVDDDFGVEDADAFEWYDKYDKLLPCKQVRLLRLWDMLRLPHEERKQEFGPSLTILGFYVDANAMTATLPPDGKDRLLDEIRDFCQSRRRTLREFQHFVGYVNWSFNVFPLMRPALCHVYAKMGDKARVHAGIYVNKPIRDDLAWMRAHVDRSLAVRFLSQEEWD
ncbi:hypothetical protein B0H21DRAFT_673081, partial [Amylocystis lapponica]